MSSYRVPAFVISLLIVLGATAAPAAAQLWISPPTIPASIPDPTTGFHITYTMGGGQYGSATAEVRFYLSTTSNGSSGVAFLTSDLVYLRGSGWGPYGAPFGTQSLYIAGGSMPPSGYALLESIRDACQPQSLYLLAQVNGGFFQYNPTVMGTAKPADFYFYDGALSSSVIPPGGTTDLSFSMHSRCAASSPSHVGIFLTDTALNPLAFLGAVSISAGAGIWSLPPTPITFSPDIPPGSYRILLVADVNNTVPESNEANNLGYFELTVASSASLGARDPGELQTGAEVREDIGAELEDLAHDPPAGYAAPLRATATHARP